MGQIVKRKKKGRPSKADLARRAATSEQQQAASTERDVRRSRRPRSVRYRLDYDDFIDEDEEDDVRRREKKLKLLLKLHSKEVGVGESAPRHAPDASASSSDDDGGDNKPLKKRKIDGNNDEVDGDDEDDENENDLNNDEEEEVRGRKAGWKGADCAPVTPQDPPLGFPLPEKKSLELILDKLQKKDTYGVYAEPVDPEELPDYHDVIEHPMDFATVRKKLGNGSYSTLEQFESDVFLICTNAMQYNAPDTIYYKQAHSILELATKKFQRLKVGAESSEKEIKSEQKAQSNSLAKKQIIKPVSRTAQEPVGSDFSSGATLAIAGDFQSGSNATQAAGSERLSNVDGPIEGSTSLIDNNLDKAEDLPTGRGLLSRFGRKPFIQDENRRASYNFADQPVSGSKSIFTTFDGEIKQLVAVGLHADLTYARSLARFAATVGPTAWKFASNRIEQALPPGYKFGRGWVGDYEPLPTPVLMLENCSPKVPDFLTKVQCTSDARKDDRTSKAPVSAQEHPDARKDDKNSKASVSAREHPDARKDDRNSKASVSSREHPVSVSSSEVKSSLVGGAAAINTTSTPTASAPVPVKEQHVRGVNLEWKEPFFCSGGSRATAIANANYQQQSPRSRNIEPEKKVKKQVELNCPPPSGNQNTRDFVTEKQIRNGMDGPNSQSTGTVTRDRSLRRQSVPFKQPENNGFVAGGLPNGKIPSNSLDRKRMVTSSSNGMPSQMVAAASYVSHGPEQGLSDPVQLMRMLAENAQKQQKALNHSPVDNPSVQSSRRDDSSNAAAAAAQAWMSIGAGGSKPSLENSTNHKNQIFTDSPYNTSGELHQQVSQFPGDFPVSGMNIRPVKNSFPFQAFMRPPVQMGNEAQFQDRPMVFPPQLVTAHLSRFQVQSPWQAPSPRRQTNQKQESLPPDLNIGFQSSGSPTRQSSGVLVDSQQPDLALQL